MRALKQREVSQETLVDELGLKSLPQLVVLELHVASTCDDLQQGLGALPVEGWDLLLYSGQDDVPELRSYGKLVSSDVLKCVANLEISEVLRVFLEYEGVVWDIMARLKSSINLMENVTWHIVEIIVASLVDHPHLGLHKYVIINHWHSSRPHQERLANSGLLGSHHSENLSLHLFHFY